MTPIFAGMPMPASRTLPALGEVQLERAPRLPNRESNRRESFGYAGIGRAEKANEMTEQGAISTRDGLNACPLPNSC